MTTGVAVISLVLISLWAVANTAPSEANTPPGLPSYLQWIRDVHKPAIGNDENEDVSPYGNVGNQKESTETDQGYQSDRPAGEDRAPKSLKRLTACKNGNKFLKTKMKNARQQFKLKLQAIKKIVSELFEGSFDDPSMPVKDFCTVNNELVEPPPSNEAVLNDYNTGSVGSNQACQLSPWGAWNALAFGTLERQRKVVRQGCGCPPQDELIEVFDLLPYLGNNTSKAFSDPKKVGDNFESDFLNPFNNGNGNGGATNNGGNGGGNGYHNGGFYNGNGGSPNGGATGGTNGGPNGGNEGTTNGGMGNGGNGGGSGSGSSVRDILMILDSSGSIETDDFDLMKEGLVSMIDLFCGGFGPRDTNNRLSIVQFASNVTVIHRFSDSQNPADLKAKVMGLRHYKGNTCTGNALETSMTDVFTKIGGMRDFTAKDTLIVTDGQSNCGIDIRQASRNLQHSSNVFALGVGIAGKIKAREEVKSVVSMQDPHHIFSLAKFADFKEMVDNLRRSQATNNPCTPIVEP